MPDQLVPYLIFDGDCGEAMNFYQSLLGGSLDVQTYAEVPGHEPDDSDDRVIHAFLRNDAIMLMASDSPAGQGVTHGDTAHLSLVSQDAERMRETFARLADGGSIQMPLEKMFWGDEFGMCTDRFGVRWMVNIGDLK